MTRLTQTLWQLPTAALIVAIGVVSCWAGESATSPTVTAEQAVSPPSVNLRPFFRKWGLNSRTQGGRGTCSVFAMTAAIEYAAARKEQHGTRLSVEFLNWAANQWDYRPRDGGCFTDLWRGFAEYGVCPESDMPYLECFDRHNEPSDDAMACAETFLALGLQLHWLKQWDSSRGVSDEQFAEIKRTLQRLWPVCGGFLWPKNDQGLWKQGVLQMCPRSNVMDGHSVLLVGYRDDATQPGGGFFLVRNSSDGRRAGKLSYEYVRAYMNDAAWIEAPGTTKDGPHG